MLRISVRPLGRSLLLVAALLSAGPSLAEGPGGNEADLEAARAAYQAGLDAVRDREWKRARKHFQRALNLKETPQLHYHVGVCEEELTELVAARASYERALALARGQRLVDVERLATERLQIVEQRLPRLKLELEPPERARLLRIDGREVALPDAAGELRLDPGTHRVEVDRTEGGPVLLTVFLQEGDRHRLRIPLDGDAPEVAPGVGGTSDAPAASGGARSVAGAVSGGALGAVGVAMLVGGIVALVGTIERDEQIDTRCGGQRDPCLPVRDPAEQKEIDAEVESINLAYAGSAVLIGGGITALGGGIALLAWGLSGDATPSGRAPLLRPSAGARGAGLELVGKF